MGYIHTVLLGHPVHNVCFASIKQIFFRYHKFFLELWYPWDPPTNKMKISHIRVKNQGKKSAWS